MVQRLTIRLPAFSPPDPLTVRAIFVRVGDTVQVGQPLFDLEMEKAIATLPSEVAGVVEEVLVAVGTSVAHNSPLLVLRVASDAERGDSADARSQ